MCALLRHRGPASRHGYARTHRTAPPHGSQCEPAFMLRGKVTIVADLVRVNV